MSEVLKPQSASQENVFCSKKKLLHFGADWIKFNIAPIDSQNPPPSIQFLNYLFQLPHNDTNASEYDSFEWPGTATQVMLKFTGKKQQDEELFIFGRNGKSLLRIIRINKKASNRIGRQYDYRIDCYGTLFDYERIGLLDVKTMLGIFLTDIERGFLRHSVTRIDICCDLSGYQVKSIKRGIIGDKKHKKKITVFNEADPESFYYGKKTDKWFARGYNKLLDIQAKSKEWVFLKLGYFNYDFVTRLEIEAHSDICLNNILTLPLCFDNEYLFGIYKSLLQTKYVQFQIVPFIESELKKIGFSIVKPVRREHIAKELSRLQYLNRTASMLENCMLRCDLSFAETIVILRRLIGTEPETGMSLNQNEVATIEDFRTIFSCKQL